MIYVIYFLFIRIYYFIKDFHEIFTIEWLKKYQLIHEFKILKDYEINEYTKIDRKYDTYLNIKSESRF